MQLENYLVRVHGKCDYLISVANHYAVLVLKQRTLLGPGVCDSILPLAFSLPSSPLPSSLLSSTQYPWRVCFGPYCAGMVDLQNPLLLSRLVICVAQAISWFRMSRVSNTVEIFLVMH